MFKLNYNFYDDDTYNDDDDDDDNDNSNNEYDDKVDDGVCCSGASSPHSRKYEGKYEVIFDVDQQNTMGSRVVRGRTSDFFCHFTPSLFR